MRWARDKVLWNAVGFISLTEGGRGKELIVVGEIICSKLDD